MRLLKRWLIPIMAVLMLLCFVIAFLPLTQREETRAKNELTELIDAAFARITASRASAGPVAEAEEAALTEKARAVARFLAHDDALLASDALAALCVQLAVDRIDVVNDQGVVIASSDGARIDFALGAQEGFVWTLGALDDQEIAQPDETDASVLYCSVPRTDIEGFVFLTRDDPYVRQALSTANTEAIIADLSYGGDLLFVAESGEEDGFFYGSGSLCLRRTENGVSLIAARENSVIFRARNTALVALAAMLVCVMICVVAAYLLHLELISPIIEEQTESAETANEHGRKARKQLLPAKEQEVDKKPPRVREKQPKQRPASPEKEKPEQENKKKPTPGSEKKGKTVRESQREEKQKPTEQTERKQSRGQRSENASRETGYKRAKTRRKGTEHPKDVEEPFDKIVD